MSVENQQKTPTLNIRCPDWKQLKSFYLEKVKKEVLSARVRFLPKQGSALVIVLGLPNGNRFKIDSFVESIHTQKIHQKYSIEIRIPDFEAQVRPALEAIVGDNLGEITNNQEAKAEDIQIPSFTKRAESNAALLPDKLREERVYPRPKALVSDVPKALQKYFWALEQTLSQLQSLGAHEVLGTRVGDSWDAIRLSYFKLAKEFHPDVWTRHNCISLTQLGAEVFMHINKAYRCVRDSLDVSHGESGIRAK